MSSHFDLVVIGSGPAGEMAAIEAAFLGKTVALIEKEPVLGGAAVNTGTIPSKTLRETALYLAGFRNRSLFGIDLSPSPEKITAKEFLYRERHVSEIQRGKIRERLDQHGVKIITGTAAFETDHEIRVTAPDGASDTVTGDVIFVATGSRPYRPVLFSTLDSDRVYDSNTILNLEHFPATMLVIGAGVIGCEYACIFASLGVGVTLIHSSDNILSFLDEEIQHLLEEALVSAGIKVVKSSQVSGAIETENGVTVSLEGGGSLSADCLLLTTGRSSNTDGLGLDLVGVELGKRGLINVNEHYQTNVSHILAAGDVVGFPALASTSIAQARIAIEHAFLPAEEERPSQFLPYGIYTIPECAIVGETEEQLIARSAEFVTGRARYRDNARGLIIGEEFGMLKLLFDRATKQLLGIHIIGEQATELIHTGIVAMSSGATSDIFLRSCFNYPTLSELYKHATYDAFGKPVLE